MVEIDEFKSIVGDIPPDYSDEFSQFAETLARDSNRNTSSNVWEALHLISRGKDRRIFIKLVYKVLYLKKYLIKS